MWHETSWKGKALDWPFICYWVPDLIRVFVWERWPQVLASSIPSIKQPTSGLPFLLVNLWAATQVSARPLLGHASWIRAPEAERVNNEKRRLTDGFVSHQRFGFPTKKEAHKHTNTQTQHAHAHINHTHEVT